ncbi:hypothetical protein F5Y17DRAFT_267373 [Xylariaceae sp. FL0594]|nr:hypothetical protein F5Y17DRAFT_267373 [Xylariaceae sp. FL0594]
MGQIEPHDEGRSLEIDSNPVQSVLPGAPGSVAKVYRKRVTQYGNPEAKRLKPTVDDNNFPPKELTPIPSTSIQPSLGPMRLTKAFAMSAKAHDAVTHPQYTVQYLSAELPTRYTQGSSDSCITDYAEPSSEYLHDQATVYTSQIETGGGTFRSREGPSSATMDFGSSYVFTQTPTEAFKSSNTLDCGHGESLPRCGTDVVYQISSSDNRNEQDDENDEYPLDDNIADDDILQLLAEQPGYVQEKQVPPSSVQQWHSESRSPVDFDPSLQHTPPKVREPNSNSDTKGSASPAKQSEASEDLLDEDMDWSAVLLAANDVQTDSSSKAHDKPIPTETVEARGCMEVREGDITLQEEKEKPLAVFVRPPFPEAIRDRPFVPGMSSETLLRTCFRVGMMIEQAARCFNHQQDVVFQLYARVTYSSRETQIRRQHFQFVDLFKDINPYPSATLSDWRAGSQIDRDSAAFLDTRAGPRLCWSICKPVRDTRAMIGWRFKVLKIREVDWDEIRWAKMVVCEHAGEQQEKRAGNVSR